MRTWLLVFILCIMVSSGFAEFAGGSGTKADPWQVASAEHLNNVRSYTGKLHADKYFIQNADIDLGVPPWNLGEGWVPIGGYGDVFHANYDGNGKVVINLYINRKEGSSIGLFGASIGNIQNLELENVNVSVPESDYVGGLVGENYGDISNCHISGNVKGESYTGALIGRNSGAKLSNCRSSGNVSGVDCIGGLVGWNNGNISDCHSAGNVNGIYCIGGLAGWNEYDNVNNCHSESNVSGKENTGGLLGYVTGEALISSCHSKGKITGEENTGGLVGKNEDCKLLNCYSLGSVDGKSYTGGLVGYNSKGDINSCYSKANVAGYHSTGGLVGYLIGDGFVNNCYSTGNVSSDEYSGGLVGWSIATDINNSYSIGLVSGKKQTGGLIGDRRFGSVENCFWNHQTSGHDKSKGGAPKNTYEMVFPHNNNTYTNWDWRVWKPDIDHSVNQGYPYLNMEDTKDTKPWSYEDLAKTCFDGGSGTEKDPWRIANAEHLNSLRYFVWEFHEDKHFIQTADIDLGVPPWNQDEGWVPIGNSEKAFHGHYNGNGKVVSNLYINRPDGICQGLFGYASAAIQYLGVVDVNISGGEYTGSIAGGGHGVIINCYGSGNVSGDFMTGGLVGENYGYIIECYSKVNVEGVSETGGLSGHNSQTIKNSYSTGSVRGEEDTTGGLVGFNDYGTINWCYSIGKVIGSGGGLLGGLIGADYKGEIYDNYWDMQSSGQKYSWGEGRTTVEMTYPYAKNTYVNWDWDIWKPDVDGSMNGGYPYLRFKNAGKRTGPYDF